MLHDSIVIFQMKKLRLLRLDSQPKDKHVEKLKVEFLLKLYLPFCYTATILEESSTTRKLMSLFEGLRIY